MKEKWVRNLILLTGIMICFLTGCTIDIEEAKQYLSELSSDESEDSYSTGQSNGKEEEYGRGDSYSEEDLGKETQKKDTSYGEDFFLYEEDREETEHNIEEPVVVESVSEEKYVYQQLNEEEKIVYDQLYHATLNFEEEVVVSTVDCDVLEKAYNALQSDHADIFWIKGFRYTEFTRNNKTIRIAVHPSYQMSLEEKESAQSEIDEEVNEYLSLIPEGADDYTIEKIFYEALAERVEYDLNAENNQNIYSVFVSKRTVCQGFTRALQYLLEKEGIQSTSISGFADGQTHAWNLVRLDGKYYHTDVTWGKTSCVEGKEEIMKVNYAWMNMTTEEIQKTHSINVDFELPECMDESMGYFTRENKYIDTMDLNTFDAMFRNSIDMGEPFFVCKFASEELLGEYRQYYLDEQHIFEYFDSLETINHCEDNRNHLLYLFY